MQENIKKNQNGEWYDSTSYNAGAGDNGMNYSSNMDEIGETSFSTDSFDIPPTSPSPDATGFTKGWNDDNKVDEYGETEGVFTAGIHGFNPVVGWLVCVDGSDKGKDYRVVSGYNYIGRSERMDICIQGDNTISRERHAMIAFDDEDQAFYFGPADGKAIVKVNGKAALSPVELNAYDVIKIGTTKLLFVPFCGDRFNWNE